MGKQLLQLLLIIGLPLSAIAARAGSISDQLTVLNADGYSYTVQQSLSSDGDLIVMTLPDNRIDLNVQFSGPEKNTFQQALALHPDRLSLWSGSTFIRYRVSQTASITQPEPDVYELSMQPEDAILYIDNPDHLHSTFTWVLPQEFDILSFTALPSTTGQSAGRWSSSSNTISLAHQGEPLGSITLRYRRIAESEPTPDPCLTVMGNTDECSPDQDKDGVPDYRDVCVAIDNATNAIAAATPDTTHDSASAGMRSADNAAQRNGITDNNALGCHNAPIIVLEGVRFRSGQSYLDVQARQVLDRVAIALQRTPDRLFEVASHTDNAGRVTHNQRLSENRADAVRHYLMLRGVGPNQLQARGYGETSPQHDNRLASGRRANRRVELRQLN